MKSIDNFIAKYRREWNNLLNHPFVVELYSGTLPLGKFRRYVEQDYIYLGFALKSLLIASSKMDPGGGSKLLEIAYADAVREIGAYEKLASEIGIEDLRGAEPLPTTLAYGSFLISTALTERPSYYIAAILPCFVSYLEIHERHRDLLLQNRVDAYRRYAETYGSEEYRKIVRSLVGLFEEIREGFREERFFLQGLRYEAMFWDMAYSGESWPF